MNMGTTSLTREQLNEAIEQFANRIMEALGANVADEEASEPELAGTHFKVIDLGGVECVANATTLAPGTVIMADIFEYFCCDGGLSACGPWVRYNGRELTYEQFAEEMRNRDTLPRIIHRG